MPRKSKLTKTAVRKIFVSEETAAALAPRYGVSTNLIHMIRQGRRHQKLTAGLTAPKRTRGRRKKAGGALPIDVGALADALLDRLLARLRRR